MWEVWQGLKYRQKLILTLLLFTIPPLLFFSVYFFTVSLKNKTREVQNDIGILIDNGLENLNSAFSSSMEKLAVLDRNYQLQFYLKTREVGDMIGVMDFFANINRIYDALRAGDQNWRISIYAFNNRIYASSFIHYASELDRKLLTEVLKADAGAIIRRYHGTEEESLNSGGYLNIYKKNVGSDGKPVAIEEVRIGLHDLSRNFQFQIPRGSFILYLLPGGGSMVLNNHGAKRETVLAAVRDYTRGRRDGNYYLSGGYLKNNAGSVTLFLPKAYVYQSLVGYLLLSLLALAALIVFIIMVVALASTFLTRRMYRLIGQINTDLDVLIEKGEIAILEGDDEFSRINAKFGELVGRIRDYYRRLADYQTEKKALELELLQALINPHFLYNTLDGIKWTCRDPVLTEVVDSMVRYYRIALNRGNKILRVAQEADMVEEYLKLQRFAYESDFRYRFALDDGIKNCLIIKHLLQPIAENAVLHGIRKRGSEGLIEIEGGMEEGKLVLVVKDNGSGMEPEKVAQIMSGVFKGTQGGYGLINIQKRIELQYGEGCGMRIESAPGLGTTVILTLPAIYEEAGITQDVR